MSHEHTDDNERGLLPAHALAAMTFAERVKYFAGTAVLTGGVLEVLGMGFTGVCLALAAGGTAAYFSEEIRGTIIDKLPTPGETRLGKLHWFITGKEEREDELLDDAADDHKQSDEREEDDDENEQERSVSLPLGRMPIAPPFPKMCHLITPERLVLCYTADGPLYGTVKDLLSMVIIGKPGRGKTTALMYLVAMLLHANAEVHVWDPHGSLSELCDIEHLHYTDELEDIPASIDALQAILEPRRKLYKASKQVLHPLLLLVDELPVIAQFGKKKDQRVFDLIEKFVLEARKWNCYFIGAGQSTDAEILPTRVTENLSSRIAFYTSNRRATMAGIDLEVAKRFLPILKPDEDEMKGKMIFDCSRLSEPVLGAIPAITMPDILNFLGNSVSRSISAISQKREDGNRGNEGGNGLEMALEAEEEASEKIISGPFPISGEMAEMDHLRSKLAVSDEKLEMISNMKKANFRDHEIASLVGLSGRKYSIYQQCLAYLGYRRDA